MKHLMFLLGIILLISSCKKSSISSDDKDSSKSWYKIGAIGSDTSISKTMYARTETVGLIIVEDNRLKAELLVYQPLPDGKGKYTIKVTNKQNCRILIRWGWEGLTIDSGSPESDTVSANGEQIFILIGDAKPGKIKLKAEGECGNSSTLIINITTQILPISFISCETHKDNNSNTIVNYSIDNPQDINYFEIYKSSDGIKWNVVYTFKCDKKTKTYSITLLNIKE